MDIVEKQLRKDLAIKRQIRNDYINQVIRAEKVLEEYKVTKLKRKKNGKFI